MAAEASGDAAASRRQAHGLPVLPVLPALQVLPVLPVLLMLLVLPALSVLPVLPVLSVLPALSVLPVLLMLSVLPALSVLPVLLVLPVLPALLVLLVRPALPVLSVLPVLHVLLVLLKLQAAAGQAALAQESGLEGKRQASPKGRQLCRNRGAKEPLHGSGPPARPVGALSTPAYAALGCTHQSCAPVQNPKLARLLCQGPTAPNHTPRQREGSRHLEEKIG